jgi:hypothetical protein
MNQTDISSQFCIHIHEKETHDFVDPEDGPNIDTGVDVAAAIQRVEHNTILPPVSLLDDDRFVQFF